MSTETFVQIIDPMLTEARVITVIEFLSPTNKRPGRDLESVIEPNNAST